MDAQVFAIWFMLPLVLLVEALIFGRLWASETEHHYGLAAREAFGSLTRRRRGIALVVAFWVVLTLAAWVYEFVIAQVLLYLLLFSLGRLAAIAGIVAFAGMLLYTPVATWRLIWRLHQTAEPAPAGLPTLRT